MSATRPIPVNEELTGIAVAAPVPNMIADQVAPSVQVGAESYKWTEYPVEQGMTVPDTKVGRLSRTKRVEFGGVERDGSVDDHGLEDAVPASDATANSAIDPRALASEQTSQLVTLARELRVRDLVYSPANYLNGQISAYGAGEGWDTPEVDALEEIEAAKDAAIVDFNTLVLGRDGWAALRKNPFMVKAARSANTSGEGRLSMNEVKDLLEIENIIIGQAMVNTAKPGQAAAPARAWSTHAALIYAERVVKSTKVFTFASTFRLTGKQTFVIPDPHIGLQGGEIIKVGERLKEQVVAKAAGWLFRNAIAGPG